LPARHFFPRPDPVRIMKKREKTGVWRLGQIAGTHLRLRVIVGGAESQVAIA